MWLYLTYKAVDWTPKGTYVCLLVVILRLMVISAVGKWLVLVFKGLQLDSADLTRSTCDTLCLCDLEVMC